jgi:hypothetical protein
LFSAIKARRRSEHERAILSAWWATRISGDASRGAVSLTDYLDELLSEDEILERSAQRLAAHFDALIEAGNTTPQ